MTILTLQQCQYHQVMWMGRLKTPPHHLTIMKNSWSYDYVLSLLIIFMFNYIDFNPLRVFTRKEESYTVLFFIKIAWYSYITEFFLKK